LRTGKTPSAEIEMKIEVPAQVYEWKAAPEARSQAQQLQERNREQFLSAFGEGLTVLGYERDTASNGKFLLGRWDEAWSYASEA
ncbi:MAG: GNAT family N-acetyltransferase, partial [Candidatus Sulfotelmatobacter sp.]